MDGCRERSVMGCIYSMVMAMVMMMMTVLNNSFYRLFHSIKDDERLNDVHFYVHSQMHLYVPLFHQCYQRQVKHLIQINDSVPCISMTDVAKCND